MESCAELESFVVNFSNTVGAVEVVPDELKEGWGEFMWQMRKDELLEEYGTLPDCNTKFRATGRSQVEAIIARLETQLPGVEISAYTGFRFLYGKGIPEGLTVLDVVAQAHEDGVTHLYIVDQDDLLYSNDMQKRGFDQIQEYLSQNPGWNVKVVGLNGYHSQPGFDELFATDIRKNVALHFPDTANDDVTVLLPCQGITQQAEANDPHGDQARALAARMVELVPEYAIELAFQNWGGEGYASPAGDIPWSAPSDYSVLPKIAESDRSKILISPNLQWPITDISVLWRQPYQYVERILEIDNTKTVETQLAWDADPAFIEFASDILYDIHANDAHSKYDVTLITKDGLEMSKP